MTFNKNLLKEILILFFICTIFFFLYTVLSVVRHESYGSYGYDLGINDQVVWEYSNLKPPVSTIGPKPETLKLTNHVEIVFALISPAYWIWSDPKMLLILQSLFFCFSGVAVYLLARKQHLNMFVSFCILIAYLMFYGAQNAIWFDAHSIVFGASFLAWFLYFFQEKKMKLTILFFLLAITSKENIAFITLFIGLVYLISRKNYFSLFITLLSLIYLTFIFFIYFPYILSITYQYANSGGLLSNLDLVSLYNTNEKITVYFYTLISYGFIPLLNPIILLPMIGDLGTYFVIGSDLKSSHGLFMHYRITLAPIMAWATIMTIYKYKNLNNKWVGFYILSFSLLVQYNLHLPLSYLTKQWFWEKNNSVTSINKVISDFLPKDASVVAQNNIIPHISQRDKIYELYPEQKQFKSDFICSESLCDWFRWYGSPQFLIVDTSSRWDERHFLINRGQYIKGLENLEKANIVKKYKQIQSTIVYEVLKNPNTVK